MIQTNNILNKSYDLPSTLDMTQDVLKTYIKSFWYDVFLPLHNSNSNIHLMLMCKIGYKQVNIEYKTIADLRRVNFGDRELFAQYLVDRLGILIDSYDIKSCTSITFTYVISDGLADDSRQLLHPEKYELSTHSFNSYKLPLTMNPLEYGVLLAEQTFSDFTRYMIKNDIKVFTIDSYGNYNKVRIEGPGDITWIDTKISDDLFSRVIGKNTIYIQNGEIIVKSKQLNAKPFKPGKLDSKLTPNTTFMTMDIETVNIENSMKPYLICAYNSDNFIQSFIKDVLNESDRKDMFTDFINKLTQIKGIRYVYAHNFSNFDGVLLLKYLLKFKDAKTEPVIYNGKLIAIKFSFIQNGKTRRITFKDSYLMAPISLRSLCAQFDVKTAKTHFPFLLTDINYVGDFPSLKY